MDRVSTLLSTAARAGLRVERLPDGSLRVQGPRSQEALARTILCRKSEVLETLRAEAVGPPPCRIAEGPYRGFLAPGGSYDPRRGEAAVRSAQRWREAQQEWVERLLRRGGRS